MQQAEYVFYGSVMPERAMVRFYNPNFQPVPIYAHLGFDIKITSLSIVMSKIIVGCVNNSAEQLNILSLKNLIETSVRSLVDVIGFTLACGYDVEITGAYCSTDKTHIVFGVHERIFDDETSQMLEKGIVHPLAPAVDDIILAAQKVPQLEVALAEFREAIRQPNFTLFHCYRAIESLRYGAPSVYKGEVRQWEWLLKLVNLSKKTKDGLHQMGGGEQRHGKVKPSSGEDRRFALATTWEVIRRLIVTQAKPTGESFSSL